MDEIEVATCYCTQKFCGHENELICGKPLSEQATAAFRLEKQDFVDYSLGICDECWTNFNKHRGQMGLTPQSGKLPPSLRRA